MKTAGIIFIIFGVLAFVRVITGLNGLPVVNTIIGGVAMIVIGVFLRYMGNRRKAKKEEKDKWEKGE